MMTNKTTDLSALLWRIYQRQVPPTAWIDDGNLPWDDPAFSTRMLAEHLDQTHNAASRTDRARKIVLDWLWEQLELAPGDEVLDFTCGPGLYAVALAQRGCQVTGIDFGPASIAYARARATEAGVQDTCRFIEQDVRQSVLPPETYDVALFLYGQLAVFKREEAVTLLTNIAQSLKPSGRLVIELLNQDQVDKKQSTWWFTDDKGLWGDAPFLHLGERYWLSEEKLSAERFYIIDLSSHNMLEINLCDQTYAVAEFTNILQQAGFGHVDVYPDWGNLNLYDKGEWVVYIARK